MTQDLSSLRLKIAEQYDEARRSLDLEVESLIAHILSIKPNQSTIDELNKRRDSQLEFLKQEERDELNRANQSNNNEHEAMQWCYFPIRKNTKVFLIQSEFILSPEQIEAYRQFIHEVYTPLQILEIFGVKFPESTSSMVKNRSYKNDSI